MCIFSGPVERVENTSIFARMIRDGDQAKQYIAYQMKLTAHQPVAMILPIPVKSGGTLEFIDLSGYPRFFDDLYELSGPRSRGVSKGALSFGDALEVKKVGGFDASFVPSVEDFSRLDPLFRLPTAALGAHPEYRDFGFAVFQFNTARGLEPHPMAFLFDLKDGSDGSLFFPTAHVHDGSSSPHEADFDHSLYFQAGEEVARLNRRFQLHPSRNAGTVLDLGKAKGIVKDAPCYRISIRGFHHNGDTLVAVPASDDPAPPKPVPSKWLAFRGDLEQLVKKHKIGAETGMLDDAIARNLVSYLKNLARDIQKGTED